MDFKKIKKKLKEGFKISSIPVLFASMCCLSPLLLFVFGFGSISLVFASQLADIFYGSYKWIFRGIGFLLLIISLVLYFRKKGICSLDKIKKNKNKIINTTLIALFISIGLYFIFLYVIVHFPGVWLGLWK